MGGGAQGGWQAAPAVQYSEAVEIACVQRGSRGTGGGRCCSSARLLGSGEACRLRACVPACLSQPSEWVQQPEPAPASASPQASRRLEARASLLTSWLWLLRLAPVILSLCINPPSSSLPPLPSRHAASLRRLAAAAPSRRSLALLPHAALASSLTSTKRSSGPRPLARAPPHAKAAAFRSSPSSPAAPRPPPASSSERPLSTSALPPSALARAWTPRATVGWKPTTARAGSGAHPSQVAASGRRSQKGWVRACQAEGTMRATRRSAAR